MYTKLFKQHLTTLNNAEFKIAYHLFSLKFQLEGETWEEDDERSTFIDTYQSLIVTLNTLLDENQNVSGYILMAVENSIREDLQFLNEIKNKYTTYFIGTCEAIQTKI